MTSTTSRCVGIVREVFSTWERRAPFTPTHVRSLVAEQGTRVLIQPSSKRVFSDAEFERAGAEISEDLSEASVIFGVKQVS
jgi:alpha-aminoadipic semialdehyde synthase